MNKNSKTYKQIEPYYKQILTGTMLAIDPSTGSKSSKPGYAWFEKGKLKESGEIDLDIKMNKSKRLYEIARTIREEFDMPDVLAVEYIPPVTYNRKGSMNSVSLMALQKAIGAILGARPFEILLEIPSAAWKYYKPVNYTKTDEMDSISIGMCVVEVARQINKEIKNKE